MGLRENEILKKGISYSLHNKKQILNASFWKKKLKGDLQAANASKGRE